MSSRLGLAGLVLASALVGGAASSYVAVAFAQQAPAVAPIAAPAPARFEHWCQRLDQKGLRVAGERGWELVAAYNDLSETKLYLKSQVASDDLSTTLPAMPTTYCFKRPAR